MYSIKYIVLPTLPCWLLVSCSVLRRSAAWALSFGRRCATGTSKGGASKKTHVNMLSFGEQHGTSHQSLGLTFEFRAVWYPVWED